MFFYDHANLISNKIYKLISKRVKIVKKKRHLTRGNMIPHDPPRVTAIIKNKRGKQYPTMLSGHVINELISNPYKKDPSFKSQSDVLWGVNSYYQPNWNNMFRTLRTDYLEVNSSLFKNTNYITKADKLLMNDVDYAVFIAERNNGIPFRKIISNPIFGVIIPNKSIIKSEFKYNLIEDAIHYTIGGDPVWLPNKLFSKIKKLSTNEFKKEIIKFFNKYKPYQITYRAKNKIKKRIRYPKPLLHLSRRILNFTNEYMDSLINDCITRSKKSSLSFGMKAYQIENGYLKFSNSILNRYRNIKYSDIGMIHSNGIKLLKLYKDDVNNQIKILRNFERIFDPNNLYGTPNVLPKTHYNV